MQIELVQQSLRFSKVFRCACLRPADLDGKEKV
jgi:hypothetical protein